MYRTALRSSAMTYASGILMAMGGLLYLFDQAHTPRNWHLFRIPSMCLMGLGVVLALVNEISTHRSKS